MAGAGGCLVTDSTNSMSSIMRNWMKDRTCNTSARRPHRQQRDLIMIRVAVEHVVVWLHACHPPRTQHDEVHEKPPDLPAVRLMPAAAQLSKSRERSEGNSRSTLPRLMCLFYQLGDSFLQQADTRQFKPKRLLEYSEGVTPKSSAKATRAEKIKKA